jgi:hypothetical protein
VMILAHNLLYQLPNAREILYGITFELQAGEFLAVPVIHFL